MKDGDFFYKFCVGLVLGVLADTIFQAVLNVEKGIWNVSQPDLSFTEEFKSV